MGEEIRNITLDSIVPHPGNRRVGGFDQAKLEELALSIEAVGVQQPAVIRPIIRRLKEDKMYQLVTGERRWRAARIAGMAALPCVIREISDEAVLKIQTIENLQREDIHPLDEAEGYRRLIEEAGYDVEHLAKDVGKSISYIYRRLKLRELSDKTRQDFIENKMTTEHAILIARIPEEQQKKCLDYISTYRGGCTDISVRNLSNFINGEFLLDLSAASFKKDDEKLYPKAGACVDCKKRTGHNPDLFEDLKGKDHCLDSKCFNHKLDEMIKRGQRELEGEDHYEVYKDWVGNPKKEALNVYDWEECKKKDEGAKPALIISGVQRGRRTYAKKREQTTYSRFENPEDEAEWKKEQYERELKISENTILNTKIHDQLILQYRLAEKKWDRNLALCIIFQLKDILWGVDIDEFLEKYFVQLPENYDDSQLQEIMEKLPDEDLEMITIEMLIQGETFTNHERMEETLLYRWAQNRSIDVKALQKSAREEAEKKLAEKEEPEKNDEA